MKERKRRRRERNVEEEEKVEEGKGKRIQSTYQEQLLMVFFFYSISSGRALCPQGRSPPSRGVVGREGTIYALKMVKISRSSPLSPPPPWKEPGKMC